MKSFNTDPLGSSVIKILNIHKFLALPKTQCVFLQFHSKQSITYKHSLLKYWMLLKITSAFLHITANIIWFIISSKNMMLTTSNF